MTSCLSVMEQYLLWANIRTKWYFGRLMLSCKNTTVTWRRPYVMSHRKPWTKFSMEQWKTWKFLKKWFIHQVITLSPLMVSSNTCVTSWIMMIHRQDKSGQNSSWPQTYVPSVMDLDSKGNPSHTRLATGISLKSPIWIWMNWQSGYLIWLRVCRQIKK